MPLAFPRPSIRRAYGWQSVNKTRYRRVDGRRGTARSHARHPATWFHRVPVKSPIQFSNSLPSPTSPPHHAQRRVEGGRSPCMTSRSRRACARVLLVTSRPLTSEGAGNAGRPMRPIAACAMGVVKRTRVSQVTPESPGIPRAMVYGLFRALPGDRLVDTVTGEVASASLTPAPRRQDHTTSPSASEAPSSEAPLASTASRLTSVTIAKRPSERGGTAANIKVIWVGGEAEFLCMRDWTTDNRMTN